MITMYTKDASKNQTWKILLIDDDEDDYLILGDMFTRIEGPSTQLVWVDSY